MLSLKLYWLHFYFPDLTKPFFIFLSHPTPNPPIQNPFLLHPSHFSCFTKNVKFKKNAWIGQKKVAQQPVKSVKDKF